MRTVLYVIYEKNGKLSRDIEYMIKELKKVVDHLIIIINGGLEQKERLREMADELIIRNNRGFDAGAYKSAFLKVEVKDLIDRSDELIFCNGTFYGPFISFSEIFERMESSKTDFWGLNYSDNGLVYFLQSYFLVFKKRILSDKVLDTFFDEYIDENTTEIVDVLLNFERGLFRYLVRGGYQFDALCRQTYHILNSSDGSVCLDKLPVLKKKAVSKKYFDRNVLLNCLKYIDSSYDYDVTMILEDLYSRYSITIEYDEIRRHKLSIQAKKIERQKINREKIFQFCDRFHKIYIYGIGRYCLSIMEILDYIDKDIIEGFIVSDGERTEQYFNGKPVYELSELKVKPDIPVIVALGRANTQTVKPYLEKFKNILPLWE